MASRAVDVDESLPGPSRSYSTAPVHKWTCAALKTWLNPLLTSVNQCKPMLTC